MFTYITYDLKNMNSTYSINISLISLYYQVLKFMKKLKTHRNFTKKILVLHFLTNAFSLDFSYFLLSLPDDEFPNTIVKMYSTIIDNEL